MLVGCTQLVHAAHVRGRSSRSRGFRQVSDKALGGQDHRGDAGSVLQSRTGDLGRVDDTGLFIYPGIELKAIDGLITNFHLPESTLIMLIAAFYGYDKTMAAYKVAVEEKYRFFSFGDAMFIR